MSDGLWLTVGGWLFQALSGGIGFLAAFIPDIFKYFSQKRDQAHERDMVKLHQQGAAQQAQFRFQEQQESGDTQAFVVAHESMKEQKSFGVQIIDALAHSGNWRWWMSPVVVLFSIMDFINMSVRSVVTYAVVGFYIAYKWARLRLMESVSDQSFQWYEGVVNLWSPEDWALLTMIIGFWFGQRQRNKRPT